MSQADVARELGLGRNQVRRLIKQMRREAAPFVRDLLQEAQKGGRAAR